MPDYHNLPSLIPCELMNGKLNEILTLVNGYPSSLVTELPPYEAKKIAVRNFSGGSGVLANFDGN
jgi:hypothetical protein